MFFDIFIIAAPEILAACGALISEFAGIMAVFLDGIINLGAFLCFSFSVFTGTVFAGCVLSIITCAVFMCLAAIFTEKTRANPFLTGLSINIFVTGVIALLSLLWFKTRGTISAELLPAKSFFTRSGTTLIAWTVVLFIAVALEKTGWGLRMRITGSHPEVLETRGFSVQKYRILSWTLAGALGAAAGCILVVRLQSFVPNISAGRGWIALAVVFLGRKKTIGTICAAVFFAAASYAANRLQGTGFIPPGVLLAFPYLAVLVLFIALPQKK